MQLTDICRLCLIKSSKTSEELFFPIDEGFEKKFNEVTNLILYKSLDENSNFPKNVCITCVGELESHYNYRCGLIEKQKRLNVLLGIKNDFEQEKKDPVIVKANEELPVYIEEPLEEDDEEHIESSEIIEDPESIEETVYDEEEPIEEMIYEQVYKEDSGDEYEIEQEYVEESDDKYYYIKEDVEGDENYIVFEDQPDQPSTSEVKPKRKYTKHSKDSEKQFKCWMEDCVSIFSFRATMRKHMQTVHGVECDRSTCLICGARFNEYSTFLSHVKTHTRKSECSICKLRFVNDEKMQAHKTRVHANDLDDRCFPCSHCNALFKRREHVNSHILYKHTPDTQARKFHCKECSSSFLTRQDMKNHEKSHRKIKVRCCYCDYEYRDLKSIRRHCEKMHDTNKIYKCSCSALFELYKELQAHKKNCTEISSTTEN
jgi:hypothetical protein